MRFKKLKLAQVHMPLRTPWVHVRQHSQLLGRSLSVLSEPMCQRELSVASDESGILQASLEDDTLVQECKNGMYCRTSESPST